MVKVIHTAEHNWPTCSQVGCNQPAVYSYVWDRDMYGCEPHTQAALNIAAAMGFPTVQNTLKRLAPFRWVDDSPAEKGESGL
jgi:hypothetical protein